MNEKLNKMLNSIDNINKFKNINALKESTFEALSLKLTGDLFATKLQPNILAVDYVPKLISANYIDNLLSIQTKQNELLRKIVFAGDTTSNLSSYINSTKSFESIINADLYSNKWKEVSNSINGNLAAFNEHISLINEVSQVFSPQSLDIISKFSQNKLGSNHFKPNYLDILSASTYIDVSYVYRTINKSNNFIEECAVIKSEVTKNSDLIREAREYTKAIIQGTEKGYIDISERFIGFLVNKLGWSRQRAYYLFLLLLTTIDIGKDITISSLMQGVNLHTQNIYYINTKTVSQDVVIKDAPIYLKRSSSTRKIGTYKRFGIVEIIKVKDGWCFVNGDALIKYKEHGESFVKDTIITGWIKQKYLKNYKD